MKKFLYILCVLLVAAGCSNDDTGNYYLDELVIDTANCTAEGSYVQGVENNDLCRASIPYENAAGGTARISAPASNGMRIDAQTVEMVAGKGEARVRITGTPLLLETSFLQLTVEYQGSKYLSSVEIPVMEDLDPDGEITFEIDEDPIYQLTDATELAFTVTPTMASVVVTSERIEGLTVSIDADPATGIGTVTLTPSASFLGGELELTANFGRREMQKRHITLCAFAAGEGTTAAPYQVSTADELKKIGYGLGKAFQLAGDITLDNTWAPAGTSTTPFTGMLDGNGKKITLALNRPADDDIALFAYVGTGADIKNLTLDGSVTGKNTVAALAANSAVAAAASVNVGAVTVLGVNHVAAAVAAGTGADAKVLTFGTVPTTVNITMGTTTASDLLGLTTRGATVTFDPGTTGTTWSYNDATGKFTVTKGNDFAAGNVTFYASLNDKVRSATRTIAVTSKNMYESGTGVEGDPYVVIDADQFTATLHVYPAAWVKLTQNITIASWETITTFSGNLDGDGHTVTGLDKPFAATLSGKVKNIKFAGVTITAGTTNCGTLANLLDGGTIEKVAVAGTITSPSAAAADDTGLGAIAGQAQGAAKIDNCYVNVTLTTNSKFATGGLVGVIKASSNVQMLNSTVEGSLSGTIAGSRMGGILGRKTNATQNSTDLISGCLVTAEVKLTGDGSNMIGGIFGALQGSTISGNYVGGISIQRSAFTGTTSGSSTIGGIGGVCGSVYDCYMGGTVQATNVLSGSTAAAAGISTAAKGNVSRCVVYGARITGGPRGTSFTAGIVNNKNGNTPAVNSCAVINTTIQTGGFAIYGTATADIVASSNYRWMVSYADTTPYQPKDPDTFGQDGTEQQPTQALFESLGYDFSTVWVWDTATSAPKLRKVGCDDNVKIQ